MTKIPFKKQTKYVVERKIDGVKGFFWKQGDNAFFEPENSVDTRVASVIDDKDFLLEGYSVDGTFYVDDVLFYNGRSLVEEEWPERYKVLKNEFRWNSAVTINRPLVVTTREEMMHAMELFDMLDYCEGVVIRKYDSLYEDERIFVPSDGVLNG